MHEAPEVMIASQRALGRGSKSQSLHVLASDKDDARFKEAEVGTARNLKGGMRCCFEGLFDRAPRDVGPSLPRAFFPLVLSVLAARAMTLGLFAALR